MIRNKSAQKAARAGEKRRLQNRSVKSAIKTHTTKVEKLIADNEIELAQSEVTTTITLLDKAAKRKIVHPNTASRRKSRLTKRLNKATLAQTGKQEIVETETSQE